MLFPRAASDPITVGPYQLTQLLGQGGMAVVYKAKRQGPAGFEKTVVVKLMLPGLISRTELVDLFRAEAKLSAQLAHPNIVQVHDFGVVDGVPFLVMEFLNGRNLTQLRTALGENGKLPLGAALAIARDMCHALGYAHDFVDPEGKRRQIIHRDVSPSNIMLCRDGMVKLLDFGVAKVAGQFDSETTQSFRGKYAYMAPEQVNRQAIDRRVDVFAAGIVLHEMLTGKRLFAAPSELETLERVAQARVIAPSVDNSEVPRKLDALVKKALSLDPSDRFSSGAEMAEALEQLNAKAWTRRKLASWLTQMFPEAFTVTCEVCGKQVVPGEECPECGSASPSSDTEVAPMQVPSVPAIDSGPLPLPPPPASASGRHLSLVKQAEAAPVDGSEALDNMSLLSPAPRDSSFEPNVIDKTPVEKAPYAGDTALPPLEPQARKVIADLEDIESAGSSPRSTAVPPSFTGFPPLSFDAPSTTRSTTRPKLFVVRDDSVKMGLLPDVNGQPTIVDAQPTSQSVPTVVATPHGQAHHQLTPRLSTVSTRPLPAVEEDTDLRPKATGWKMAFALLIGGGIAALATMVYLQTTTPHHDPEVIAAPAARAAPIVSRAPVVVAPPPAQTVQLAEPVVVEPPPPPAETPPPPSKPAAVAKAAPNRRHVAHKRETRAVEAAPRSSVKEGRIVDPFAGGD